VSVIIQKAGILSTIQDLGRFGYQRFGVNPNGAMDRTAVRLLNTLLGDDQNSAVLEMHFPGGEFLFDDATVFAVGGADFRPRLSGDEIPNWTSHMAKSGSVLAFAGKTCGNRAYLAVAGGFEIPKWLGSASTSLTAEIGGHKGRRLQNGDRLQCDGREIASGNRLGPSLIPPYCSRPVIRVTPGPEYDVLTGSSVEALFSGSFAISSDSNRMGFRLAGPSLFRLSETEMLSSGTAFGTIQLLPNGQLVVLMADHQTTGGYPRIANVIERDLPLLAQLGPGDKVEFSLIAHSEAERLLLDLERDLSFLRTGLRLRSAEKL
jgi:antagonist of KipI